MTKTEPTFDSLEVEATPCGMQAGCQRCGSGYAAGVLAESESGDTQFRTAVRFGYMRYVGEFTHPPEVRYTTAAKVIIQTKRGIELGEQVPLTCNGCERSVPREKMRAWVQECGLDSFIFDAGRLLREATAADLAEYAHIQSTNREKRDFCQQVADRLELPIDVVECESPFGGERIIFYFIAERRVDFRAMVKDLAREFRTRIEMRQVGARDEARLLADFETCGQEVCCKKFLKTLRPIQMRMAKMQKATLDPTKVSGRCGRLKCCFLYEHATYEELEAKLPKTNSRVPSPVGEAVVVGRQTLTQLVQVRAQDGTLHTFRVDELVEQPEPPEQPQAPPADTRRQPRQPRAAAAKGEAEAPANGEKRPRRRSRSRRGSGRPAQSRPEGAPKPESPATDSSDSASKVDEDGRKTAGPESAGDGQAASRRRRRPRRRRRRDRPPSSGEQGGGPDKPSG